MKFKYIALLSLTVSSTLLSCANASYTPKKYFSKYTYREYQRNNFYNAGSAPSIGDCKVLVIPIWFTDSNNYIHEDKKENVRSDIEQAYFGTVEETGWHSVSSFYKLDSFGRYNITGVVAPWYEIGKPSTDYYSSDSDMGGLFFDAVSWYKQLIGDNKLKSFDADADGFLDGVVYIYGAPDSTNLPNVNAQNLWGYTTWVTSTVPNKQSPNIKNVFWASYDFMYDKNTAIERAGTSAHRGDNQIAKIDAHCFIHEWGHNYGLPDYYDYDGMNTFAGGFSMQDYNVGAHDPYSRYSLGWIEPFIPTQSCTIKLKPIETSGEAILLAPSFTNSCFDEYILLEYYTPTGLNEMDSNHPYRGNYPSGLIEPGIRIWHVDSRLLRFSMSGLKEITTDPTKSYLYPATSNDTFNEAIQSIIDEPAYRTFSSKLSQDFHTLTLMRNNKDCSYEYSTEVKSEDLFYEGDSFSLSKFSQQFANGNKLNNTKSFTWKVTIEEIGKEYATIKLTK